MIFYQEVILRKKFQENKVAVELMNSKNVDFKICNIDMGVGILKIKDGFQYKVMPELKEMNYKNFLEFYKNFPLISSENALDFISQD